MENEECVFRNCGLGTKGQNISLQTSGSGNVLSEVILKSEKE